MTDAKQLALKFLEEIKPEDKIALIFHDDLDGFASGILLYDYLIKKGCKDVEKKAIGLTLPEWEEIIPKLKTKEVVIFADLAPNIILTALNELRDKRLLSIDHHKREVELPKEVVDYRVIEKYFPASRIVYSLVGGKEWLAVAGTLADEGDKYPENVDFINNFLKKEKLNKDEYKQNIAYKSGNFIIYFREHKKEKEAFEILERMNSYSDIKTISKYAEPIEREIEKYVKNFGKNKEILGKIIYYQIEPKYPVKAVIINILSNKNPGEPFIFVSTRDEKISISSRCQNGSIDMIKLLEEAVKNLQGASCGGHPKAAGCSIQTKDLEKFKNNLRNLKI